MHVYAYLDAHVNGNGGGGTANGGADTGAVDSSGVGVVGDTQHRQPGDEPRLRGADLHGARLAAAAAGLGRLRRQRVRRRSPQLDAEPRARGRPTRPRRPATSSLTEQLKSARAPHIRPEPRLRAHAGAGGRGREGVGDDAVRVSPRPPTWPAGPVYDASLTGRRPPVIGVCPPPPRCAPTTSAPTCSRPARTRRSRARSSASLASPWGQAVSAGAVGRRQAGLLRFLPRGVRPRPLRDVHRSSSPTVTVATAQAATRFLFEKQQLPTGEIPRNSLLNGKVAPDTGGDQLDESSYPILMAYLSGLGGDDALWPDHIKPAADFVVAHGPSFGVERWEEQSGYSPSTIAAEIAGLTAAAKIATMQARHRERPRLPGGRRRLPAQRQGLDGHVDRAVQLVAVLHPAVEDRRPERGDLVQPRQRRPARRRSARRGRRRVPGTRTPRRAVADRSRLPQLAGRRWTTRSRSPRRPAPATTATAPMPLRTAAPTVTATATNRATPPVRPSGSAVADDRHRHRAPVAGAVRRARRVRPC